MWEGEREERRGEEIFLVGADGRRDVGTVLFIQRVVNDAAVLQGHLWLDKRD